MKYKVGHYLRFKLFETERYGIVVDVVQGTVYYSAYMYGDTWSSTATFFNGEGRNNLPEILDIDDVQFKLIAM